jgi:hypothetical protein
MAIIKSARFVQPHSAHRVVIEIRCDHSGVANAACPVSAIASTETFRLSEISNLRDGPAGDALASYLMAASSTGLIRAAIDHARGKGW